MDATKPQQMPKQHKRKKQSTMDDYSASSLAQAVVPTWIRPRDAGRWARRRVMAGSRLGVARVAIGIASFLVLSLGRYWLAEAMGIDLTTTSYTVLSLIVTFCTVFLSMIVVPRLLFPRRARRDRRVAQIVRRLPMRHRADERGVDVLTLELREEYWRSVQARNRLVPWLFVVFGIPF